MRIVSDEWHSFRWVLYSGKNEEALYIEKGVYAWIPWYPDEDRPFCHCLQEFYSLTR